MARFRATCCGKLMRSPTSPDHCGRARSECRRRYAPTHLWASRGFPRTRPLLTESRQVDDTPA
ncbi:MAG: hypothetical protein LBS40_01315, partial [Burkholderiales bacterium]|nr:hypothetical protein [Burkholderiales bacterium]